MNKEPEPPRHPLRLPWFKPLVSWVVPEVRGWRGEARAWLVGGLAGASVGAQGDCPRTAAFLGGGGGHGLRDNYRGHPFSG